MNWTRVTRHNPCPICGKPFVVTALRRKYCSDECHKEGRLIKLRAWKKRYRQTAKGKAEHRRYQVSHQRNIPRYIRNARGLINDRIRRGVLKREPCEACGNSKSEAHHDDHTKPAEVRWLCRTHHLEHHAKLDQG